MQATGHETNPPLKQTSDPLDAAASLRQLVEEFSGDYDSARQSIFELLELDPPAFYRATTSVLQSLEGTPGHKFLVGLLMSSDHVLASLCDPRALRLDDAVTWATGLVGGEPLLDVKLMNLLGDNGVADIERTLRVLEIVSSFSDGRRLLPFLMLLMRHPNQRVRSKASLLIARTNKDVRWVEKQMLDPDPRIRANAVEALWGQTAESAVAVFRSASEDIHHRVAANALVGLYLAGHAEAADELEQMATFSNPLTRAAAAWAMGFVASPTFVSTLRLLAKDLEPTVRQSAVRACVRINRHASEKAAADSTSTAAPTAAPAPLDAAPAAVTLDKDPDPVSS